MTTTNPATAPVDDMAYLETTTTYNVDGDVISEAVRNAVIAAGRQPIGQYGEAFLVPAGYQLAVQDSRTLSDPELPHHRVHAATFIGVRSLAQYVNRYATEDTLGYIRDLTGAGVAALTTDTNVAEYVLDDHPVNATAFRSHLARLLLRPTTAARRWGKALAATALDQEQLLDLIVDGIGEIANPDGAALRDLVSDLHAIRTTSARSVIRTGGQATVEVTDNVTLHGGVGNTVTVPETITVMFTPFASIATAPILLKITVKPRITTADKVTFQLAAPALDDEIDRAVGEIAAQLTEGTGLEPLWVQ